MNHLLIFSSLAHSLWMFIFLLFGIDWVKPGSVVNLLFCWHHWMGIFNIWNLVIGCLMETICTECNRRSFDDTEKSLTQLLDMYQRTLFDWS